MTEIEVRRTGGGEDRSRFEVLVTEPDGSASFDVTLSRADRDRLAGGYPSEEAFIRACFGFLLQREPRGSILGSFDVGVIPTYFPEFERAIAGSAG